MPEFMIGRMSIPYEIKENARLKRMRLTISGEAVQVQGPIGMSEDAAAKLLRENEKWLFEKMRDLQENPPFSPWPERFLPGAKVFWNGRWEMIHERIVDNTISCVIVEFKNGFVLRVPNGSEDAEALRSAFIRLSQG